MALPVPVLEPVPVLGRVLVAVAVLVLVAVVQSALVLELALVPGLVPVPVVVEECKSLVVVLVAAYRRKQAPAGIPPTSGLILPSAFS